MSAVLVTGASGFAGSHLLDRLRGTGDIVAWSRSHAAREDGVRWQQVDVRDGVAVRAALRELRPDRVYHCAGVAHVSESWSSPTAPLAVNVLGTQYLLDGLRRSGRQCRVLVTGSATIYAPSTSPLTEESPLRPDNPYGTSKLAQELLALRAAAEDGLDVVVARAFNHTGPRQTPAYMAPSIARQIVSIEAGHGEPVIRVGNLEVERDICDVRDVVAAYVALMHGGVSGEVYNVASGAGHAVREVVETLVGLSRVAVRIEVDPARVRPIDNPRLVGDASKLRQLTGWSPAISFEQMLLDLLNSWRATVG
jgi:GDP-4-dehydro-6-deoxy-D-mannose reductase